MVAQVQLAEIQQRLRQVLGSPEPEPVLLVVVLLLAVLLVMVRRAVVLEALGNPAKVAASISISSTRTATVK